MHLRLCFFQRAREVSARLLEGNSGLAGSSIDWDAEGVRGTLLRSLSKGDSFSCTSAFFRTRSFAYGVLPKHETSERRKEKCGGGGPSLHFELDGCWTSTTQGALESECTPGRDPPAPTKAFVLFTACCNVAQTVLTTYGPGEGE
jgi:hypothetical protein